MKNKLIKLIKAIKEEDTKELNDLISDPEILDKLLTYTAKLARLPQDEYNYFLRLLEYSEKEIDPIYSTVYPQGPKFDDPRYHYFIDKEPDIDFKYFNRNDPYSVLEILSEIDNEEGSNTNLLGLQKELEKFFNEIEDKNTKYN